MIGAELGLALALLLQVPMEPTVTIILNGQEQTLKVKDAELMLEHIDHFLEPERTRIMAALVIGLGTLPVQQKCITWQQHVAEVRSWHEAPEREYVECDDPRVGSPLKTDHLK